jgi:YbgC/YbaW family acyl-CoA thioester hydrolase
MSKPIDFASTADSSSTTGSGTVEVGFADTVVGPPLVYRRRIGWADTDAARIVYTVRFFDYGMAAVEAWFREIWGMHWYRMHVELDMGAPCVHVDMDMQAPLVPDDILAVTVLVEKIGRASLTFQLEGVKQDGIRCFTARYVHSLVRMSPMRAAEIPAEKRALVEDYMRRCNAS